MVKVKNLHNTSGRTPAGFPSWIDYWEWKTGRKWPKYCCVAGCLEEAAVGAHVKKVGSADNRWFIVPLCKKHNSSYYDDEFWVNERDLVLVND